MAKRYNLNAITLSVRYAILSGVGWQVPRKEGEIGGVAVGQKSITLLVANLLDANSMKPRQETERGFALSSGCVRSLNAAIHALARAIQKRIASGNKVL